MIRKALVCIVAAGALLASGPLPAQAEDTSARDLRCLVLTLMYSETNSEGAMGVMYFLGRLEGRDPGRDWLTAAMKQVETITKEQVAANAQVCGQILIDKGQEMVRKSGVEEAPPKSL